MNTPKLSLAQDYLKVTIILVGVCLAIGKLLLIIEVDLFQDEVFYWQESQRLSFAYSDLPLLTAWLIHFGTSVFGDTPAGVRAIFYLLGISAPFAMYWLARPIVGNRHAIYAAGLFFVMPLLAFSGAIAGPDVALIVCNLLGLGCLERALRTGENRFWLLTGLCIAVGFASHYRFAPFIAAGFLYFVATQRGRGAWQQPGLYLAGCIGLLGVLPLLYFNFAYDNAAVGYHLVERHTWKFSSKGIEYPLEQALFVTPLLYGLLIYCFIKMIGLARQGDAHARFFSFFVAVQAGVYYLLSPFMDQSRVSYHWPLSGYLPLLIYLPGFARQLLETARSTGRRRLAATFITASLVLAVMLSSAVMIAHGMQSRYQDYYPGLSQKFIRENSNFAGWREMTEKARELLDAVIATQHLAAPPSLLVGEHYVVAAQLEFQLDARYDAYSLLDWKPIADGRALQLQLWDKDARGLAKRTGENALVVLMTAERKRYSGKRHRQAIEKLCSVFSELTKLDQLSLWGGVKGFEYYLGRNVQARERPRAECLKANFPLFDWHQHLQSTR